MAHKLSGQAKRQIKAPHPMGACLKGSLKGIKLLDALDLFELHQAGGYELSPSQNDGLLRARTGGEITPQKGRQSGHVVARSV